MEALKEAVLEFLRGGDNSDVVALESILHRQFQNVQLGWKEEAGIVVLSKSEYIDLIEKGEFGGVRRTVRFVQLEQEGPVGMAKVELESEAIHFVSFILLLQEKGKWWVSGNYPHYTLK